MGATVGAPAVPQPWVTLALFVAFALLAVIGLPPGAVPISLFVVGALLAASFRWRVGRPAAIAMVVAGLLLRLDTRAGSDVLIVTRAAIEVALAGGNPYGIGYAESVPPGAPFPYGPLALLWYLPPVPAVVIDFAAAAAILALLAVRGRMLGLAVYAMAPVLAMTAADGSNDTSLGLLLLVGLGVLPRKPIVGAFAVGLAIAFKPTAAAWAAPLIGWAGLPGLVGLAAGAGLFWLPALTMWGPVAVATSIFGAATLHQQPYYSLAYSLQRYGVVLPSVVYSVGSVVAGGFLALVSLVKVRSADAVIGWGAAIFLVTLFAGFWSTFAYFAAIGPIVCWKIDGWLGQADSRVRWPSDPWARLRAWLDARWPAVESGPQRRFR
jgi:hypothetical protein